MTSISVARDPAATARQCGNVADRLAIARSWLCRTRCPPSGLEDYRKR
ncbi:MAG: hypothetical protein KDH15_22480 [Rhodocyclaceae bacterium]|nr:hypothetical protein [Rhodocyclaceae bacterium]